MKKTSNILFHLSTVFALFAANSAAAVELDWSGTFRSEFNFVNNYSMDSSDAGQSFDPARYAGGGYYTPGGGSDDANWTTLFLRLKPKVVVNDNVYIKSEFWVGDPIFGMFGNTAPYSVDQRQYNSTFGRGSILRAQRFWGEFLSDVGTIQVGRAPLNYGLGIVWNSGDGVWDRYESSGDLVRLVSKFGAFSFSPAVITQTLGNSFGGSCTPTTGGLPFGCVASSGVGSLVDYSIMLKYENLDEDFEGGVNFIRRLGAGRQETYLGPGATPTGFSFNTWDLYVKKRMGNLLLGAEAPIVSGQMGSGKYTSFAVATEADWRASDTWQFTGKLGHVAGQPTNSTGDFKAFYFHPGYRLGLIMFNYQLANFAGPVTQNNTGTSEASLRSPYDNPITNAQYLAAATTLHANKWDLMLGTVFAKANTACKTGETCFNQVSRQYITSNGTQGKSYGWELDFGTTFHWDDNMQFGFDTGLYFPGDFYSFSNTAQANRKSVVWANVLKVGVTF